MTQAEIDKLDHFASDAMKALLAAYYSDREFTIAINQAAMRKGCSSDFIIAQMAYVQAQAMMDARKHWIAG